MDALKSFTGGNNQGENAGGNQSGGIMDSINNAAGGGQQGEAKEDYLDKGVDYAQQYAGQGDQSNEGAVEQQKDEMISDQIRSQYKNYTGSDVPIQDK